MVWGILPPAIPGIAQFLSSEGEKLQNVKDTEEIVNQVQKNITKGRMWHKLTKFEKSQLIFAEVRKEYLPSQ